MKLRVLLLCCPGRYQRRLAARAAQEFDLAGIVVQSTPGQQRSLPARLGRYSNPLVLARHLLARAALPAHERRAAALLGELFPDSQCGDWPAGVARIEVADVNSAEAVAFVRERAPELVLVNGTNLLRRPMLALLPRIRLGIVNLHTGLSPYSRGGNCNLFMLLEGRPELVGLTIHHIDRGIDSGDILITEQVAMEAGDNYEMVDARTFHQGIECLLAAAHQLDEGRSVRVRQWETGKLFLRRTGYAYEPFHRWRANRLLARGLVRDYLADKAARDAGVRLVGARP